MRYQLPSASLCQRTRRSGRSSGRSWRSALRVDVRLQRVLLIGDPRVGLRLDGCLGFAWRRRTLVDAEAREDEKLAVGAGIRNHGVKVLRERVRRKEILPKPNREQIVADNRVREGIGLILEYFLTISASTSSLPLTNFNCDVSSIAATQPLAICAIDSLRLCASDLKLISKMGSARSWVALWYPRTHSANVFRA